MLGYIVNNPEIMKDYDVTTLSALVMAGVGSSPAFKSKLVQLFPDSMVSNDYRIQQQYT